jgi:hypothetical protein
MADKCDQVRFCWVFSHVPPPPPPHDCDLHVNIRRVIAAFDVCGSSFFPRFIMSQKVQLFFVCLLLLDVLILFTELGEWWETGAWHRE